MRWSLLYCNLYIYITPTRNFQNPKFKQTRKRAYNVWRIVLYIIHINILYYRRLHHHDTIFPYQRNVSNKT